MPPLPDPPARSDSLHRPEPPSTAAAPQLTNDQLLKTVFEQAAPQTPPRARVLVVDDEPLMGSAIARVLAEYDVFALTSGRAALSVIGAGQRFDVILCDIMMPDFNGMDLYRGIARDAPDLLPRVVFMTGGAFTSDAAEFLERVPNPRLEKPISPKDLHDAVAQMLEATRM